MRNRQELIKTSAKKVADTNGQREINQAYDPHPNSADGCREFGVQA